MPFLISTRRPDEAPGLANCQGTAASGLQFGLAFMAVVSVQPYFMWGYQKVYYAVATLIVLVSLAGSLRRLSLPRERLILCVAFSLFLIYLSLLPKVYGGVTRWFLLIPFVVALLSVRPDDLQQAFEKFYWFFALSLVPGILIWAWVVAGLPLEFRWMTPPSEIIQRGVIDYLERPGAVFLESNGIILPNGGVMFRLCGIYDEPNSVGTVAALCLAVTRFRLRDIRGVISFAAGIMSFSVAFSVLTVVGFIATAVAAKRPWLLLAALASAAVGALPVSGLTFGSDVKALTQITVVRPSAQATSSTPDEATTYRELFAPPEGMRLRFAAEFDDRAQPKMRQLFADYARSSARTLLFGLASDASYVYSGGSSVWMQVLTNYGIVGFAWAFVLFFIPLVYLWRGGRLDVFAMIFCGLFLMSFYQRPIIWLPAEVLIYFAGLYYVARASRSNVINANPGGGGQAG